MEKLKKTMDIIEKNFTKIEENHGKIEENHTKRTNAANSMENGQNWKPAKKTLNGETNPKTIPDPCKNMGQDTRS